jgi:hypothetical protein
MQEVERKLLVSVAITFFNAERFLRETVERMRLLLHDTIDDDGAQ